MKTPTVEKKCQQLTLADYKKIWTPFCFFDESGNLGIKNQPYFTVGMIKCSQPYYLQQRIRSIRERENFWWEIKFNALNRVKLKTAISILSALFETRSVYFSSFTIDKRSEYFRKEYNEDPFVAYEQITKHLLEGNIRKNEILTVLADNMTAPKENCFEVNIKNQINFQFQRLAIAGVCRIDSKTNDLLQLADLVIGSINYELLLKEKIIPKASKHKGRFIKTLKENLGVSTLTCDFRSYGFNIRFHKNDCAEGDKMKKAINQSS